MSQAFDRERLIDLTGLLFDEQITEEEVAELEAMLKSHQEARQLFHLTTAVHRDLQLCDIDAGSMEGSGEALVTVSRSAAISQVDSPRETRRTTSRQFAVVAGLVAFVLGLTGYLNFRGGNDAPILQGGVVVTDLVDIEWAAGETPLNVGDEVASRRLRIAEGSIRLTFPHGVVTTIDGPADVELISHELATLHLGQLVAYVPEGAEGLRVSTPAAEIIDLGTEFGVTADKDGTSGVIVFDGEVELAATGGLNAGPQKVSAGLARRIDRDGSVHQDEFRQASFEAPRSLLRRRRVIRETFRTDGLFPGSRERGWTAPWQLTDRLGRSGGQTSEIQTDNPLMPGTRNYLTVNSSGNSSTEPASAMLSRGFASFDQFDSTRPYTIEFCFRLECDPADVRQIRISSAAEGQVDSTVSEGDAEMWLVRTVRPSNDSEELQWRVYHPEGSNHPFATLPIVQGRTYRFLIEVDPVVRRWRTTISDGQRSIWNTLRNGDPLRLHSDAAVAGTLLRWQMTGLPRSDISFSLDAIRIQNPPEAVSLIAGQ